MLGCDHLEPEEIEAIEKLKERVGHKLTPRQIQDETFYYRFLKARDFNMDQAEAMILKHLSDWTCYNLEEIVENYKPPQDLSKYFSVSFLGYDKDGSVVRYVDLGKIDPKGLLSVYTFKQLVQYCAEFLERDMECLKEQSEKLGKSLTKISAIINVDQLNLFRATYKKGIDALIKGLSLFQDNYPERVKSIYLINCAFYFTLVFPLVKSILASSLVQKIQLFGKDDWKETLLEVIDADVLPAFLGGNRTDPDGDPLCLTFITHGKKVPEELYSKNQCSLSLKEDDVKKLVVPRFSCSDIMFDILEPNTIIEWEFETKTKDIGFGLFYKDGSQIDSEVEELIPIQRVDTLLSSETGIYRCDRKGAYIIVFDNTYSWIFSKEIYYRIRTTNQQQSSAN